MNERILIIEDEEDLVKGLKVNLTAEGYRVESACNGREGLQKALKFPPQLILLDLMLPGMDGLDVCREVRRRGLTTPIIILTAKGEEIDKVVGLEIGADDYVTKPFGLRELLARIRARLRRRQGEDPATGDTFSTSDFAVDYRQFTVRRGTTQQSLTSAEMEILRYLIQHEGSVVSREELLTRIWGNQVGYTTRTIDNHILKLRKKIEKDPSRPRHILSVYAEGYRFVAS